MTMSTAMSAPPTVTTSNADVSKGQATTGEEEGTESTYRNGSEAETTVDSDKPAVAAAAAADAAVNEEDEEVRLAMEMALAAAQNPHLSPAELRKLVGEKNKQTSIVVEAQKEKEKKVKEVKEKQWEEQKQQAFSWWAGQKKAFNDLSELAAQKAAEAAWEAEKQYYAEEIKRDPSTVDVRKKMKIIRKTIKAHKLQGNRVETRHTFKRQRMEKKLLQTSEKLAKLQVLFTKSGYNVAEYAKAMMRACKKWNKKSPQEELSLEAQLCRNMHQMLAVEKQKAMLKKQSREIKKYLQRCKGWLSDKKAFCELHMMTLDATASSMRFLYEDTLTKQDTLIGRLKAMDEFKDVDLSTVDTGVDFDIPGMDHIGPRELLNALRGLPITDSIRLKKEDLVKIDGSGVAAPVSTNRTTGGRELVIEANNDDNSVSSHLSDPDDDEGVAEPVENLKEGAAGDDDEDSGGDFGNDAPWNQKQAVSEHSDEVLEDVKPHAKAASLMGVVEEGQNGES